MFFAGGTAAFLEEPDDKVYAMVFMFDFNAMSVKQMSIFHNPSVGDADNSVFNTMMAISHAKFDNQSTLFGYAVHQFECCTLKSANHVLAGCRSGYIIRMDADLNPVGNALKVKYAANSCYFVFPDAFQARFHTNDYLQIIVTPLKDDF